MTQMLATDGPGARRSLAAVTVVWLFALIASGISPHDREIASIRG
jgi:hypothetical protein